MKVFVKAVFSISIKRCPKRLAVPYGTTLFLDAALMFNGFKCNKNVFYVVLIIPEPNMTKKIGFRKKN